MMDGFRTAVYAKLNGDNTLTSLLATTTSIYHRRAPLDANFPLIIFSKQSGVPIWCFDGEPLANQLWIFKGVDRAESASRAEDIDKRIGQVLTDPVMTLSDGTLLYMRRESDVDYEEGDSDILIHHVGGSYRTYIDRA
jgi:Protein of unknown function (DUF3168)